MVLLINICGKIIFIGGDYKMQCKKCGSEMELIESDDVLGIWEYVCTNDNCNIRAIIDDRYDYIQWEED